MASLEPIAAAAAQKMLTAAEQKRLDDKAAAEQKRLDDKAAAEQKRLDDKAQRKAERYALKLKAAQEAHRAKKIARLSAANDVSSVTTKPKVSASDLCKNARAAVLDAAEADDATAHEGGRDEAVGDGPAVKDVVGDGQAEKDAVGDGQAEKGDGPAVKDAVGDGQAEKDAVGDGQAEKGDGQAVKDAVGDGQAEKDAVGDGQAEKGDGQAEKDAVGDGQGIGGGKGAKKVFINLVDDLVDEEQVAEGGKVTDNSRVGEACNSDVTDASRVPATIACPRCGNDADLNVADDASESECTRFEVEVEPFSDHDEPIDDAVEDSSFGGCTIKVRNSEVFCRLRVQSLSPGQTVYVNILSRSFILRPTVDEDTMVRISGVMVRRPVGSTAAQRSKDAAGDQAEATSGDT
jgi:hypothetical protein